MGTILGALISSLGFGTANVVIKKSLADLSSAQVLTMSTISGLISIGIFVAATGASDNLELNLFLAAAGLAILEVIFYLMLYKAFDSSNVTIATALINTYPIYSTVFAIFILGENIASYKYIGIVLMVIGAIVISIRWQEVFKNGFDTSDFSKGIHWIIIATAIHAVYFPLLGTFTSDGSWEVRLLLVKLFSAIYIFIIFALVLRKVIIPKKDKISFTSMLGLLEMIGWVGFSWATSNNNGETAVVIAILNSAALVTAILAYIFLKEKLSTVQYLGVLVIVAGLIVLSY